MGIYIAIAVIAGIVNLIAFIWLVIAGFQRSVLWGILIFLLSPLAALVFAIMYWYDAKKPFLLYIISTVAMVIPLVMMFSEMDTEQLARVVEGLESGEIKPNEAFDQYAKNDELGEAALPTGEVVGDIVTPADPATADSTLAPMEAGTEAVPVPAETMTKLDGVENPETASAATDENAVAAVEQEQEVSRYPTPGKIMPDPLVVKKQKAESPTVRIKLENITSYKGRYFIITTSDGNQHRGLLHKVSDDSLFLSRVLYGGNFEYRIAKKRVKHVDMLKEAYVKEFMER